MSKETTTSKKKKKKKKKKKEKKKKERTVSPLRLPTGYRYINYPNIPIRGTSIFEVTPVIHENSSSRNVT